MEPHGRYQSFGRDGLRLSVRSWQRVLVPDGAGEDTGDQACQDVAAARDSRPRRGGRRDQRGVAAGHAVFHALQVGEIQLRVDEAGEQRLIAEHVRVFEGPHDGHRTLEHDVAARGIVEEVRVAQGGCGDLVPLRRRAEPRQQACGLTVVRGEDGGLGVDGVRQLRNQVEGPRVDDERHAGLAAELREFERVLAAVLVQSGADEGRLDAPAHRDDARLGGQHEVLDAPGGVQAHHADAGRQSPARGEQAGARVGVGSGDEADDATRVLVVVKGRGLNESAAAGSVVEVHRNLAARFLRVSERQADESGPLHLDEFQGATILRGGRQDLGALEAAHGHRVRGAHDGALHVPLVVGQARGHINRDNRRVGEEREVVELFNGLGEVPLEGPLATDAHNAVDPHFRERHQGELGRIKNCGDRSPFEVHDGDPSCLSGAQRTGVALSFEQDRRHVDAHVSEGRACVQGIASVVTPSDEGDDVRPRAGDGGFVRSGEQRGCVTDEAGNALRDRVADLAHVQVRVIDLRCLADKALFD